MSDPTPTADDLCRDCEGTGTLIFEDGDSMTCPACAGNGDVLNVWADIAWTQDHSGEWREATDE